MMRGYSRRGQPLVALILIVGGWASARAMMWEPDPMLRAGSLVPHLAVASHNAKRTAPPTSKLGGMSVAPPSMHLGLARGTGANFASPSPHLPYNEPITAELPAFSPYTPSVLVPAAPSGIAHSPPQPVLQAPTPVSGRVPVSIAAGHQLLWMAAVAYLPLPAALTGFPQIAQRTPEPFYPAGQEPLVRTRRWSADGWMLWRRGSTGAPAGGLLTPSYGASQAGVVLRYRLAPNSGHRPAIYLRTTAALNGSNEREAALGLSARPFSRLPISIAGEARLTSTPGGNIVRPSAYAVTELPPFVLPLGLRGEFYGQAGYVGGKFATGFADGQLRADHGLMRLGRGELRLGGGVWGGIQKGASRIDAGPSLTVLQPLGGPAAMRLAADWRFRVAGKAAPGSGPAVTLSAGF